jgi:hypothetical protein
MRQPCLVRRTINQKRPLPRFFVILFLNITLPSLQTSQVSKTCLVCKLINTRHRVLQATPAAAIFTLN